MNHIKSITEEEKAWCGDALGIDFYFKSLDATAMNGLFLESRYPCGTCLELAIQALLKNKGDQNEQRAKDDSNGFVEPTESDS